MKDAEKRVAVRRWFWLGLPVAAGAVLAWCYRDWLAARFFLRHLESGKRLKRLRVPEVIRLLGIEPGSTVADIGAGSGLFTERFVDCVGPTGRVFAADANPTMIDHLRKRFPPDRAPTVTVVQWENGHAKHRCEPLLHSDALPELEEVIPLSISMNPEIRTA